MLLIYNSVIHSRKRRVFKLSTRSEGSKEASKGQVLPNRKLKQYGKYKKHVKKYALLGKSQIGNIQRQGKIVAIIVDSVTVPNSCTRVLTVCKDVKTCNQVCIWFEYW